MAKRRDQKTPETKVSGPRTWHNKGDHLWLASEGGFTLSWQAPKWVLEIPGREPDWFIAEDDRAAITVAERIIKGLQAGGDVPGQRLSPGGRVWYRGYGDRWTSYDERVSLTLGQISSPSGTSRCWVLGGPGAMDKRTFLDPVNQTIEEAIATADVELGHTPIPTALDHAPTEVRDNRYLLLRAMNLLGDARYVRDDTVGREAWFRERRAVHDETSSILNNVTTEKP